VGRGRLGVRLAPHPVRDVLRRRAVRDLGHSFRTYDWDGAGALLDDLLAGYDADVAASGSTLAAQ